MQKSKEIYLDNAGATPLDPSVLSVMQKVLKESFANPGSIHAMGVKDKKILEKNREEVAKILGAHDDEIIFTSGATESNNLAILGVVRKFLEISHPCALPRVRVGTLGDSKFQETFALPHIVTTNIEHPSVLETCRHLEETKQAEVTYVPVESDGIVDPKKIKKAIRSNTVLVSVMYANNEIGTIQPIQEIAKEVRHYKKTRAVIFSNGLAGVGSPENRGPEKNLQPKFFPLFHIDATQAVNYLPIKVEKLGIDLMSFNSGKIYGPKGVGVLYIKRKTPISPILWGGSQEFGLRPGTENISMVAGLTEALKITERIKEKEVKRLTKLRDYFIQKLSKIKIENKSFGAGLAGVGDPGNRGPEKTFNFGFLLNGSHINRLPNNVNITIPKIPSDLLVLEFSARGIYISEKSACKSGEKAGSYVIRAIRQIPDKICTKNSEGSLRFSLGRQTTKADIDYVLKSLSEILKKLKKWYL